MLANTCRLGATFIEREEVVHFYLKVVCNNTITMNLQKVFSVKHISLPYVCEICKVSCSNKETLEAHMRSHNENITDGQSYICGICKKGFMCLSDLKIHLASHSDARPFTCEVCWKKFKTPYAYHGHMRKLHVVAGKWFCRVCNVAFASAKILGMHIRDMHWFKCDCCNESFRCRLHFKKHKADHGKFLCEVCGKVYVNTAHFKLHQYKHRQKTFQCGSCTKTFSYRLAFLVHSKSHINETPYKCHLCTRSFKLERSLKQHLRVHTGENLINCDQCDKYFLSQNILKNHKRRCHLVYT